MNASFSCTHITFYSLKKRNELLRQKGVEFPSPVKTGTTIAGVVFKDGIILGADTRATEVFQSLFFVRVLLMESNFS